MAHCPPVIHERNRSNREEAALEHSILKALDEAPIAPERQGTPERHHCGPPTPRLNWTTETDSKNKDPVKLLDHQISNRPRAFSRRGQEP